MKEYEKIMKYLARSLGNYSETNRMTGRSIYGVAMADLKPGDAVIAASKDHARALLNECGHDHRLFNLYSARTYFKLEEIFRQNPPTMRFHIDHFVWECVIKDDLDTLLMSYQELEIRQR